MLFEAFEASIHLFFLNVQIRHPGGWGAEPEPLQHAVDLVGAALDHGEYGAIVLIHDPTPNVQRMRLAQCGMAETHTLYVPPDRDSISFYAFAHGPIAYNNQ